MFIFLTLITGICWIYCIDWPIISDKLAFLVNDHNSMAYGIGLSIIAAYIFYIFQVVIPTKYKEYKYRSYVWNELNAIQKLMERDLKILTGKLFQSGSSYDAETIQKVLAYQDIIEDGSTESENGTELTIIDAVYKNELKIKERIRPLLEHELVSNKTKKALRKWEVSNFQSIIEQVYENKPGRIVTIDQKRGKSLGGIRAGNMDYFHREIAKALIIYVESYRDIRKIMETQF